MPKSAEDKRTPNGPGNPNSLRDWAEASYSPTTGRGASSVGGSPPGAGNASTQINQVKAGGQNGAPGVDAMNRSGSGDPGRRKWGGTQLP